MASLARYQVVA